MNQEKIYDIEKRIAELKFLERDLIKERDVERLKSLNKSEKSDIIEKVKKDFFITSLKVADKDIIVNSFPSKFNGRNDEEFMSEVKVEIRFKPSDINSHYNELSINVYLNSGFQVEEVQSLEKSIMDRLIEIRKDVEELKESKKTLKQNN